MNFEKSLDFAKQLDEQDPLKQFRNKFYVPIINGQECIYFTGNSLGLQPRTTQEYVLNELEDWASFGVEGHFHARQPWFSYHEMFPQLLTKIIGGLPEEIVVMNQLTVNLHLLMASFFQPTKERFKIICEAKAFPSDQYAFESQVRFHGLNPEDTIIEVAPRTGEHVIRTEDIIETIKQHGSQAAVVIFSGVNYYNGQVFDMKAITQTAHEAGAYCGFDLAHAAGNIELHMHDWDVDFACWCSYKYLNSGPGGVAGAYINKRHAGNKTLPRLAGWWGYEKETRFQMEKGFKPIPTAEGWQLSNAPVLSMAAHRASLDIFEDAGMERLIAKGQLLSDYLMFIIEEINSLSDTKRIEVITPKGAKGCQVSMHMLEKGKEIFEALK
ncbi:MAG TPA: kynureninase, partial [Ferruginibacter sp.]|nr:kynureninase [Ferruginibacter sp.]